MEIMTDQRMKTLTTRATEIQLAHAFLYAIGAAKAKKEPICGQADEEPWNILVRAIKYIMKVEN